jgi:hypothetical protein
MTHRPRPWGLLVLPLLLAGCAGASTASPTTPSMAGMTGAVDVAPPDTAEMVCGADISRKVVQVLSLTSAPKTSTTWLDSVYTCTYDLPMGAMVLSVQVAPSDAAAGKDFDAERARRAPTTELAGLGEDAFGTATGVTVVRKDNQVLTVDTTALPAVFGSNSQRRTDLANEIASDVLGCWTGDGDE